MTVPDRPARQLLLGLLVLSTILTALGFLGADRAIATGTRPVQALDALVTGLEIVTGKLWFDFLLPLALVAGGAVALALRRKSLGRPLLYIGLVQLFAYLAADLAKPQFGRLRPLEAAAAGGGDVWFAGANSFPSGHVAFFAGLAIPVVLLFPRAWPLLAMPLLVAAQRVLSHDHYVSDAGASLLLACLLTWALRPGPPPAADAKAAAAAAAASRSR